MTEEAELKDKEWLMKTLEYILSFYESERMILGKSKEEATQKVLEIYDDFYDVFTGKKKL
jgi:hypothetical protein